MAPRTTQATGRLTPLMAWQLAAPHTWPAAVVPVLVAYAAAHGVVGPPSAPMALALLAIAVLMQSAVNALNDYFDYVKGSDSAEDSVEASDAVLVYNDVSPRAALWLAVGLLAAAFGIGLWVVWQAGPFPLAIGIVGALVVALYSGGRSPLSYLPVGELASGVVMGALIPLASYQALSGRIELLVLVWSLPAVIGIALIMMTNNACDIEKDVPAGRRTLPVLLGRNRTRRLYQALLVAWPLCAVAVVAVWFPSGGVVLPFLLLGAYPLLRALAKNPLLPATRIGAMGQVCAANVALGGLYACALLA